MPFDPNDSVGPIVEAVEQIYNQHLINMRHAIQEDIRRLEQKHGSIAVQDALAEALLRRKVAAS